MIQDDITNRMHVRQIHVGISCVMSKVSLKLKWRLIKQQLQGLKNRNLPSTKSLARATEQVRIRLALIFTTAMIQPHSVVHEYMYVRENL